MTLNQISAEIISRPGGLGDVAYPALEIQLKGFESPYVLTLAFPAVVYRALSERVDPGGRLRRDRPRREQGGRATAITLMPSGAVQTRVASACRPDTRIRWRRGMMVATQGA